MNILNFHFWNPWIGLLSGMFGDWNGTQNLLPYPYSGFSENNWYMSAQINYDDPSHLTNRNGTAVFIATPSNKFSYLGYSYASAAMTTKTALLPATGGYVQWNAKMPDSRTGAWGGMWMISADNSAEFDLQESGYVLGNTNPNQVLATNWHSGWPYQIVQDTGMDLSANYHTYGVEYIPGQSFTVYLDGVQMYQTTDSVPTIGWELITDLEVAGPLASGVHTVVDPNNPGTFEMDVKGIQYYTLQQMSTRYP